MSRSIVLASTSIYRRALLEQLGISFETANPELDETPFKETAEDPESLVTVLSEAKARALADQFPDALIIGSDQCAAIDNEVLHKPGGESAALAQLSRLSGRTHRLLTGVYILDSASGKGRFHLDVHELRMRSLTREQLQRYLIHDEPWDCAGSYRIEAQGVALFDEIRGADSTAIVGLPLMAVVRLSGEHGVEVFDR